MFDHYNQIESYKQEVINLTNQSGLTVGMAFYVLKDILNELYLVYLQQKDKLEEYEDKEYTQTAEVNPNHTKIEDVSLEELKEGLDDETN